MRSKTFQETITALNSQAQGICSLEGYKIFVENALVGEEIQGEIFKEKKRFAHAKVLHYFNKSLDRVTPMCPIFEKCGGCQIMHMSIKAQLKFKQTKVLEALKKISGLDIKHLPIIPSPTPLHYRHKIQLSIFLQDGKIELGFCEEKTHSPICVQECFIHSKGARSAFLVVKKLLAEASFSVFNPKTNQGFLKKLILRNSLTQNKCLVIWMTTHEKERKALITLSKKLMIMCPEIEGVLINHKNAIGKSYISESLLGSLFKLSGHSFFQINPKQATNLYQTALNFADLTSDKILVDAYCGTGTLAILASKKAKSVVGIESSKSSIDDAKENAKINSAANVSFICGRVENHLKVLQKADIVIINPPRIGCEKTVLQALIKARVQKIIYISCDPATLARDLKILNESHYELKKLQLFDMFPQTVHVESCALLEYGK